MMIDLRSMAIPSDTELLQQAEIQAQKEQDRSCDLAKREHKYMWLWNEDGKITNWVRCGKCGQTKFLGK